MKFITAKIISFLKLKFNKKYKNIINELGNLIVKCSNVLHEEQANECIEDIVRLNMKLPEGNSYITVKEILGALLLYLNDTIFHIENKYHYPAHNNYNIKNTFPDINDYIDLGFKIKNNGFVL